MTRMLLTLNALILISFASLSPVLQADVLLIEEVRQSERMNLPVNGLTTQEVTSEFGDPEKIHAAVGDPPISSWDYGRWSVYFEYDLVLFTVLHKGEILDKNKEENG